MHRLILACLLFAGSLSAPLARADTGMKITTAKGYVAYVVGEEWRAVSLQTRTPVASAVYQIPNPADAGTPESTNIVLIVYDLRSQAGREGFEAPLPQYTEEEPVESTVEGWQVFRHSGLQNDVEYTILDARRQEVADVAASVRLAWPHLPGNDAGYDQAMESTFKSFLASVQGHIGPWTPANEEVVHRAAGAQ